jgi:hypothetical protein
MSLEHYVIAAVVCNWYLHYINLCSLSKKIYLLFLLSMLLMPMKHSSTVAQYTTLAPVFLCAILYPWSLTSCFLCRHSLPQDIGGTDNLSRGCACLHWECSSQLLDLYRRCLRFCKVGLEVPFVNLLFVCRHCVWSCRLWSDLTNIKFPNTR